jgi:hypothetical protein
LLDLISAILVQYDKAEIFWVGKRNIKNQKIIDNWGNAKIALSRHLGIQVLIPSHSSPFPNLFFIAHNIV